MAHLPAHQVAQLKFNRVVTFPGHHQLLKMEGPKNISFIAFFIFFLYPFPIDCFVALFLSPLFVHWDIQTFSVTYTVTFLDTFLKNKPWTNGEIMCKIFEHFALPADPVIGFIQPGSTQFKDSTILAPKLSDPPFWWKSNSTPSKTGSSLPIPDQLIFCTI